MMGEWAFGLGYTVVALILLLPVGNEICRQMLDRSGLKPTPEAEPGAAAKTGGAGRLIGTLERLILSVGLIAQSWEVLAAVIALKTVARFRELDEKAFAEYFLVGSLFSLLWTLVVTTGWLAFDRSFGLGLQAWLSPTAIEARATGWSACSHNALKGADCRGDAAAP